MMKIIKQKKTFKKKTNAFDWISLLLDRMIYATGGWGRSISIDSFSFVYPNRSSLPILHKTERGRPLSARSWRIYTSSCSVGFNLVDFRLGLLPLLCRRRVILRTIQTHPNSLRHLRSRNRVNLFCWSDRPVILLNHPIMNEKWSVSGWVLVIAMSEWSFR